MSTFTSRSNLCKSVLCVLGISLAQVSPVSANVDPFLGEIQVFGGNFCPRGWTEANGQILPINSNQSLFSLLGTNFGGDGRTSFALPDYRGRTPIGLGNGGGGIGNYNLAARGGVEGIQLTNANIPEHTHVATTTTLVNASSQRGRIASPDNVVFADDGSDNVYDPTAPNVDLASAAISSSTSISPAGNQAVDNMQPYQTMTVCIALSGLFPPRS